MQAHAHRAVSGGVYFETESRSLCLRNTNLTLSLWNCNRHLAYLRDIERLSEHLRACNASEQNCERVTKLCLVEPKHAALPSTDPRHVEWPGLSTTGVGSGGGSEPLVARVRRGLSGTRPKCHAREGQEHQGYARPAAGIVSTNGRILYWLFWHPLKRSPIVSQQGLPRCDGRGVRGFAGRGYRVWCRSRHRYVT
jgi:hypothetical protein